MMLTAAALLFASAGLVALAPSAGAAPGSLDPSFGDGGHVFARTVAETAPSEFSAVARELDDDLIVELNHDTIGIGSVRKIEMRTRKGTLVRSFGHAGRVGVERGSGLMALSDGDILVDADRCDGKRSSVEMLDRHGARVASFGDDGCAASVGFDPEYVNTDPQGRILLGGARTHCPCSKSMLPASETVIARLLPDGGLDASFGENGLVGTHSTLALEELNGYAPAAIVGTADGGVLIAAGPGLIRLDASGALDPAYGDGGIAKAPGGSDGLLIESDGSALLTSGGFESYAHASRFTPDGDLDPSFGTKGRIVLRSRPHSTLAAVVPLADGRYLVAGQEDFPADCDPCDQTPFLERLTARGRPDPSYGVDGVARFHLSLSRFPNPATQRALVVDPDGSAIVFGNDYQRNAIALARNAKGAPETSFGRRGTLIERHAHPVQLDPTGLALSPDGLTLMNERFTGPGIVTGFQIRFDGDGKQLHGPGGAPAVETLSHGEIVAIRRGVVIWEESEPEHIVHALRTAGPNGLPIKGYGRNGNGRGKYPNGFISEAVAPAPAGGVLVVGSIRERVMAAYLIGPNGHPVRSFGEDGLATVGFRHASSIAYAGTAEADGGVVVTGQVGNHLVAARLLPDGRLDRRFGHGGRLRVALRGSTAGGLIAQAGTGVVIGAFEVNQESRYVLTRLVRLDADGRLIRGFGRHGIIHAAEARHPLALFAGGGRIVLVDNPRFERSHKGGGVELRSYKPDGSVDLSFGTHGVRFFGAGTDEEHVFTPAAAVQQSDGKVVVAGTARNGKRAKAELLRFLIR